MARAVQRSLATYLPARKKTLAVNRKEEQQQQTDGAQRKRAPAASSQLVESVRAVPRSDSVQKRQRISQPDEPQTDSGRTEREQPRSPQQRHQPPLVQHAQLPPPLPAYQTAQTNRTSAETSDELLTPSENVSEPVTPLAAPLSTPLPVSSSSPAHLLPRTEQSATPPTSRPAASMAQADLSFLSAEQRRRRDFIEQTVRDCLQVPSHITDEPTHAQLASLIRPSAANRPPLPRPSTAAPSTPTKRRPTSTTEPVSSIAALSATLPSSSPSSVSSPSSLPLPLPVSYRLLLSIFSAMECAISVRSQSSVLWSALLPAVVRIVQKSVSLLQLQQLACVMPDCYELREERSADGWGRVKVDVRVARLRLSGGEKEEAAGAAAALSASSSAELALRRQLLERRLLERAIDEHHRWYSSSTLATQPFDPLTAGRWHPAFPLDSLPPLPTADVKNAAKSEKLSALDALESLTGHKRKWDEVEPLTPRSSVSRASSNASELLLTPSTRASSSSSMLSLLDTPSTPFTARSVYVEQFRRRAAAKQFEHADRATPAQLERLQHLGKLPPLLDVVHYCLHTSGRHMMEHEQLLSLVASGSPTFTHGPSLRLQFELLVATLPTAFSRRSIGPADAPRQLVGLTRRMSVDEMKAALKVAKDREEDEMREERRLAREALLRSVEGGAEEGKVAAAAAVDVVRVAHVASPAKRSLHSALMAVSPGGTERPVADSRAAPTMNAADQPANRQLYR